MKFKLLTMSITLLFLSNLWAQKTDTYFEYTYFPKNQLNTPRTLPISSTQFYWVNEFDRNYSNPQGIIDSFTICKLHQPFRQSYSMPNRNPFPISIHYMEKDSMLWYKILYPKKLNTIMGLNVVNCLKSGNNMLLYCYVNSDSLFINDYKTGLTSFKLPGNSGFVLLKVTNTSQITIENYFPCSSDVSSRLIWANSTKYTALFTPNTWDNLSTIQQLIPAADRISDTPNISFLLQFNIGSTQLQNYMSGVFPDFDHNILGKNNNNQYFLNNTLILAGEGGGWKTTPVYKIGNNPITKLTIPASINLANKYIYWITFDMSLWKVNEYQFIENRKNKNYINYNPIVNFGILKNSYWFQFDYLDSIVPITSGATPIACIPGIKLFSYKTNTKSLLINSFTPGIRNVISDGDSLFFVYGNNKGNFPNDYYADVDKNPNTKYPILKGPFAGEFDENGNIVWARSITLEKINTYSGTAFSGINNGRILIDQPNFNFDMDFAFRSLKRIYIDWTDISGFCLQLSKAPISDMYIDTLWDNHIFITYVGALNAKFYYKFSDGTKDSLVNQRSIRHDFAKKGTYMIYVIAKNQYGSDTAYFEFQVDALSSGVKLNEKGKISVYPNPSYNSFSWRDIDATKVEVFDLEGKLLLSENQPGNSINLQNLNSGAYLLVIHSKQGSFCNKIMKL